jgi:hypothetical protein
VVVSQDCSIVKAVWPVEAYCDPGRDVFRAFGLGESSAREFLDPAFWARLARALARGHLPGPITGAPYQLGGAIVFDEQGEILHYSGSARMSQLVDIPEILRVLDTHPRPGTGGP